MTDDETIQHQMQVEEMFMREIFAKFPDPVLIVGRDGIIARCNDKASTFLGYVRDSLVGQPIDMLIPDAARKTHGANIQHYFSDPYTRPMGVNLDIAVLTKDLGSIPVTIHLAPVVHGDQGTLAMAVLRRKG